MSIAVMFIDPFLSMLTDELVGVLAVRRRAWGPPFAYPPLMSHIFFTEDLNEIGDSI